MAADSTAATMATTPTHARGWLRRRAIAQTKSRPKNTALDSIITERPQNCAYGETANALTTHSASVRSGRHASSVR